jgi:KTSC domain
MKVAATPNKTQGVAKITREPVVSSIINEVGYRPDTQTLEIQFVSGAIYLYHFVPEEVHRGLMSAASVGTYFNREIKPVYQHQRIAEPNEALRPRPRGPGLARRRQTKAPVRGKRA